MEPVAAWQAFDVMGYFDLLTPAFAAASAHFIIIALCVHFDIRLRVALIQRLLLTVVEIKTAHAERDQFVHFFDSDH